MAKLGDVFKIGALASKPAAGIAGRIYLPSDAPYLFEDDGSAWQAFGPISKLTVPVLGDTSWSNQGSATIDASHGMLNLTTPVESGENWRMRIMNAPATPYTLTALVIPRLLPVDFNVCGIFFRQSSDGKMATLQLLNNTAAGTPAPKILSSSKRTSASTSLADYVTFKWGEFTPLWMQISDDGTNRICRISRDGQQFTQVHSVARTDHITADQIGFGAAAINATYAAGIGIVSWAIS